jgi:leucyl/phenylalanyl-tRNA--protein transferase
MPIIHRVSEQDPFPPSSEALDYPNGLLAVGGDLSQERLIAAYRRGIFPWYEEPQPVMWWTPDPRSVLFPDELHVSRSLRRTLRQDRYTLSVDRHFDQVMGCCAAPRVDGPGTWIGGQMRVAYQGLHRRGLAHSIEVLNEGGDLVGGLYGVAVGQAFFGESMFSLEPNTSKIALVALVDILRRGDFKLIACQVESEHLNKLGARCISRLDFEQWLAQTGTVTTDPGIWCLPATCGALA